ncbi:hypothetical protein N0V83_002511 [Neocucurbitaria cava]|uniref:Xylanolytic transcriptional activator regulatory domain-containing protein n=1 Tax=Neocucurbitaria cava TaxID=798079 RepID=A0A9W9CPK5_9PLEO|nr:hypothetical protein N0V83_002511 [Neocucurbitaria cava]
MKLGIYRREFAGSHADLQPIVEESMRRTWYELYVIDGCIAAFQREPSFKTSTVNADVLLPCEDSLYEHGMCLPSSASRDDFENSVFADEETVFSSFCYRIEAVRLLGRVLSITGEHGVQREQVQAADNALAAFLHHLPPTKREPEIIFISGVLKSLSRYWSIADVLLRPLKKVALRVFQPLRNGCSGPSHQAETLDGTTYPPPQASTNDISLDDLDFQNLNDLFGLDAEVFCL